MGNSLVLSSPIFNPTARKIVSFNSAIYQTIESFHSDNKEVGGKGIALSQTLKFGKKPAGDPFMRTEKEAVEMHHFI